MGEEAGEERERKMCDILIREIRERAGDLETKDSPAF